MKQENTFIITLKNGNRNFKTENYRTIIGWERIKKRQQLVKRKLKEKGKGKIEGKNKTKEIKVSNKNLKKRKDLIYYFIILSNTTEFFLLLFVQFSIYNIK